MAINEKLPKIIMKLYETDIYELQKFIAAAKIEGELTKEYLKKIHSHTYWDVTF